MIVGCTNEQTSFKFFFSKGTEAHIILAINDYENKNNLKFEKSAKNDLELPFVSNYTIFGKKEYRILILYFKKYNYSLRTH